MLLKVKNKLICSVFTYLFVHLAAKWTHKNLTCTISMSGLEFSAAKGSHVVLRSTFLSACSSVCVLHASFIFLSVVSR